MPLLGNLILWLGGLLAPLLAKILTRKALFGGVVVGILIATAAALYSTITAVAAGLAVAMPTYVMVGCSWLVPDNLTGCNTAYLSSYVAIAVAKFGMNLRLVVANA